MASEINNLPDQLIKGWEIAESVDMGSYNPCDAIIMSGMGGSEIGADLISAFLENQIKIPIILHRNYSLPDWVRGKRHYVICSSHSGNTEETLSSFNEAIKRGCSVISISTGGQLDQFSKEKNIPIIQFSHHGQPRSAVGFSFGILLHLINMLHLVRDFRQDLIECVSFLKKEQESLLITSPIKKNPAKRLAGQIVGKFISIFASDFLSPVARRWKGQINELAKSWCQYDVLPEANHNTLAGILEPSEKLSDQFALFINSNLISCENQKRIKFMSRELLINGIANDTVFANGSSRLQQMWYAIIFGDYLAYYLALLYGRDPTPIEPITLFKKKMQDLVD